MKKTLFFVFVLSLPTIFTSCTKDKVLPAVIKTENPPKEIWGANQIYLQTYIGYAEEGEMFPENKGYFQPCTPCNGGIQNVYYQAGTWYLLKVHKYWGVYKGITYVSTGYINAAVEGNNFLAIKEIADRTGSVKIGIGTNNGSNPIGTDYTLYGPIY